MSNYTDENTVPALAQHLPRRDSSMQSLAFAKTHSPSASGRHSKIWTGTAGGARVPVRMRFATPSSPALLGQEQQGSDPNAIVDQHERNSYTEGTLVGKGSVHIVGEGMKLGGLGLDLQETVTPPLFLKKRSTTAPASVGSVSFRKHETESGLSKSPSSFPDFAVVDIADPSVSTLRLQHETAIDPII